MGASPPHKDLPCRGMCDLSQNIRERSTRAPADDELRDHGPILDSPSDTILLGAVNLHVVVIVWNF